MKKPLLFLLPLTVLAGPLLMAVTLIAFVAVGHADCDTDPGGSQLPAVHVDPASVPGGRVAGYGHEQLVNAAHIMLAARDKGLSLRDQRIGVMTAMGESSLRVLDHGDTAGADSRGLFQQRDSWGSLADRMDPYKSSVLFFNAMVKVEGREDLEPTLVAHRTQNNADPYHYRPYWAPAGEVVDALGQVRASDPVPVSDTTGDPYQLGHVRPQLRALVNVLAPMFGIDSIGGYRPSATDPNGHPAGLAADFMVPLDTHGKRRGDALAAYAQAHAEELHVDYMIWRQRIWSVARAAEGWRPMGDRGSATENHFDHVHINVEATAGNVPISTATSGPECDLVQVGYSGTWVMPVDSDRITDDYGPGRDAFGGTRFHTGVDWGAPCGSPVKAASDGTVVKAGPADSIYGQNVVIDHGNKVATMYGHMHASGVIVSAGDQVSAGQRIGEVGSAGRSTGCHLHFEVLLQGKHTDPIKFLANPPTLGGDGVYTVTRKKPYGRMYHAGWCCSAEGLSQYHKANSAQGIRYAAAHGYAQIDLDVMTTADGVIVVNHSFGAMSKEDFSAPGVPNRPIDQLTWAQVSQLRRPDGYRIRSLAELLPLLKAEGLIGALELKGDGREGYRLINPAKIGEIADLANAASAHVFIKVSEKKLRLREGMRIAHERGFWTRVNHSDYFWPPA